jgi:hypothetical protein
MLPEAVPGSDADRPGGRRRDLDIYPVKQPGTGIVILLLTMLNAALGPSQEGKAAAVAALSKSSWPRPTA